MSTYPASLCPWINRQFTDLNGDPLADGLVYFYTAGTTNAKDVYHDAQMVSAWTQPVTLDGEGRATIFLGPGGYDVAVHDAADVEQYTVEGVEDVGLTFLSTIGTTFATGSLNQTSGYTVLPTDYLVTMASTGGANPCVVNLPPAAEYTGVLCIKNLGTVALAVTPDGSETIDSVAAAFTVAAGSSPTFPSIVLISDGSAAWYIQSSHP